MTIQLSIFDAPSFSAIVKAQNPPEPKTDEWGKQLRDVYQVMRDGRWRSLAEIAFHSGHPEASVSARIRDLARKGFPHFKKKAKDGKLFEYQLAC